MQNASILLVEDDPSDLELAKLAFRKSQIANPIEVARDGAEALDKLGLSGSPLVGEPPCLILLDLKLPKVDGIEVLRRVKGSEKLRLIPVVMLTSSHEESDIVTSYDLGVNSYIVKPVDFNQFVESVRQLSMYWLLLNQPPRVEGAAA